MSAAAEQQARFSEGRTRMGFPVTPQVRVKRPMVPAEPVVKIEPPKPMPVVAAPARPRRQLHWSRIVQEVAEQHNIDVPSIMGEARFLHIVRARNEAMWRMRHEIVVDGKPISFPQIGRRFGKDHTSVLHSVRKHQELLDSKGSGGNAEIACGQNQIS